MKEILDVKSKKKVDAIEKIFHSKNHICAQSDLLDELQVTYPTLISLIETINHDAIKFGYTDFSIIHTPSNQLYVLNASEESSVQLIIHSYIKESPRFKLLELLLTTSFPNLQSVADNLFVSYASIRKDIRELNRTLKKYLVHISTKNGVRLEGD